MTPRENMPPEPADVLEMNLRRLFARSYVPVMAPAAFRARLSAELAAQLSANLAARSANLAARSAGARASVPRTIVPRTRFASRTLIAAAALVVAALVTWAILAGQSKSESLDSILARGCVAVRGAEGGWRALDAQAASRGIDAGAQRLEVATPSAVSVRVRLESAGHVTLGPAARAILDDPAAVADLPQGESVLHFAAQSEPVGQSAGPTLALRLQSGSAAVERYGRGASWFLVGCGACVVIERGTVHFAIEDARTFGGAGDCLTAQVERGLAHAWVGGRWTALEAGTRLALQGDRALEARVGVDDPRATRARAPAAIAGDSGAAQTSAEPAPATTARLEGTLHAPDGLARPARWTVTLLRHERLPEVSQPEAHPFDGPERFAIDGLEPGTYEVFVETAGLGVWHADPVVLDAGATRTLDVQLARGLTLRGRILDAQSGAPLEGAFVLAEEDVPAQVIAFDVGSGGASLPTWSACTVTNSDGTFELTRLGSGPRTVRATMKGHGAAWSALVDTSAGDEPIVLRLERSGSIAGHVARADGTPWSGAIVIASHIGASQRMTRLGYGIAKTDALGEYRIDDLPAGPFVVLNVLEAATTTNVRQAQVAAGATTTVDLPDRDAGARVSGRVLDSAGKAVSAVDVTLQPAGSRNSEGWRSQRSDSEGKYAFTGLRAGAYDVFIGTSMGRRFVRQDVVDVPESGAIEHDVHLDDGAVRGRATSAVDGTPCAEAFVLVERRTAEEFIFAGIDFTAADGTFAIEHLRHGTWRVTIYPATRGLAPARSAELVVAPGSLEKRCDLAVPRGAALRILVRDAAGQPAAGSTVTFTHADGETVQLTANDVTDAQGVLDVPGLHAVHWTLRAQNGARASAPLVLDLLPGDDREIVLQLSP